MAEIPNKRLIPTGSGKFRLR